LAVTETGHRKRWAGSDYDVLSAAEGPLELADLRSDCRGSLE